MELVLTQTNFKTEVIDSNVPVLVDFWATWCGPCRMMSSTVEELANEANGKYKVGKVNIDDEQALSMQYGVQSIPTFIVFVNGKEVNRIMGSRPKDDLINILKV